MGWQTAAQGSGKDCAMVALGRLLGGINGNVDHNRAGDDATRAFGDGRRAARAHSRARSGLWREQNEEPRTCCDWERRLPV